MIKTEVYNLKENKKFTRTFDMSDYEILTDDGFIGLESLHETIEYEKWILQTENFELDCADDHIVFDENMNEIFVKDLQIGDKIITKNGPEIVTEIYNTGIMENMYDFELIEGSNRRYYTNGILSHNTELAKQLAQYMFNSEDNLIRIDMSEFMEKTAMTRITGSSQGYVGYEDKTILDEIRNKPYSVILFDEIEKAHPDVFNLFLQMMDNGIVTDSHGRKVSFKNSVILLTSNVGTKKVKDFGTGVGFNTKNKLNNSDESIKSILDKELKNKFAPEFINRLDEIIYFKDLTKEDILEIVDLELNKTINRAKNIGFDLKVNKTMKEYLVEVGYDPKYGARPLKRAIQKNIDDYVTEFILENDPKEGSELVITYSKSKETPVVKFGKEKTDKTEIK